MKFLTFIIFIFFAVSCSNEKTPSVITIDLLPSTVTELKNLSEIATDIQYIPLETSPEALMRFVTNFKATDDKFYINTIQELLCFDKSGKFLYKLDQQGRGPNEYIFITDYDVRPETNKVIVLAGGKLFFYSQTDTGLQISKQLDLKIQPQYCDFIPDQGNILLSYISASGQNKYQCICISPEGDTLFTRPNYYKFTKNTRVTLGFRTDNVINNIDGKLWIKSFLSDTIYTINSDYRIIPYMILNTGGNGVTTDFIANVPAPDMNSANPISKFLSIYEILEVERYLFSKQSFQSSEYWKVFDKNTGESSQIDTKKLLKDDISGGIDIEPKFASNGLLYSSTDALTFKKYMSDIAIQNVEFKDPVRADEIKKLAASIKEDDNYILILITPKK